MAADAMEPYLPMDMTGDFIGIHFTREPVASTVLTHWPLGNLNKILGT